jgi:hypothetical protein
MERKCIQSAAVLEHIPRRTFSVKNPEKRQRTKRNKIQVNKICGRNEVPNLSIISDAIHVIQFTTTKLSFENLLFVTCELNRQHTITYN